MSKREIEVEKATRVLNAGGVVLVTASFEGKDTITPVAWNVPVSKDPPLVLVAISPERFVYSLIKGSGEFGVNLPSEALLEKVYFCGRRSGREVDKFKATGLTRLKARFIKAPLIKECIANIECKVMNIYPAGDHELFVGKVLRVVVDRGVFDGRLMVENSRCRTLHHLGGSVFAVLGRVVSVGD